MKLTVKVDTRQVTKLLEQVKKQTRFAQVNAINSVAYSILMAERNNISKTFVHPRPFTVNNNFYTKATVAKPVAIIGAKPRSNAYLAPYEFGGAHYIPSRAGVPANALLIPVNIKVDAYGQIPSGAVLQRILARPDVFVGVVGEINGIWLRPPKSPTSRGAGGRKGVPTRGGIQTAGLTLLIRIEPNKPVNEHLNFEARGMQLFEKLYPAAFEVAFAKAMATARN